MDFYPTEETVGPLSTPQPMLMIIALQMIWPWIHPTEDIPPTFRADRDELKSGFLLSGILVLLQAY